MKSRISIVTAAALAAFSFACGNGTEPPEYADVSGTFEGSVTGTVQGGISGTFSGTGSLTVTQEEGGEARR